MLTWCCEGVIVEHILETSVDVDLCSELFGRHEARVCEDSSESRVVLLFVCVFICHCGLMRKIVIYFSFLAD